MPDASVDPKSNAKLLPSDKTMTAAMLTETLADRNFTTLAWGAIHPIRDAIEQLPLLTKLADGSLPGDVFRHYIMQDALYLHQYARCLAIVAAKAPDGPQMLRFLTSAQTAIQVEQALHGKILGRFGLNAETIASAKPSPAGFAYTSFILSIAHSSSYAVTLASILPCFWIYRDVGERIKRQIPVPGNPFQEWIDTYGDPQFAAATEEVIAMTDKAAALASPGERQQMLDVFTRASQYEWMFWNSAWQLEQWPV